MLALEAGSVSTGEMMLTFSWVSSALTLSLQLNSSWLLSRNRCVMENVTESDVDVIK
jgi:hypothetical protein